MINYTTFKIPLNKITTPYFDNEKFLKVISNSNKIVFYTYIVLKIWILKKHKENNIPFIEIELVKTIFNSIKQKTRCNTRDSPEFREIYNSISKEDIDFTNTNQILDYKAKDIVKDVNNNIELNFISHLRRFVNLSFKDEHNNILSQYKNKERTKKKKELVAELNKVKNDLINNTLESNSCYHEWIKTYRAKLLPILETPTKEELKKQLKKIKDDIKILDNNYKSDEVFHVWIETNIQKLRSYSDTNLNLLLNKLLKIKDSDKISNDEYLILSEEFPDVNSTSHYIELKKNPQSYFYYFINIAKELEKINKKVFHISPLKKNIYLSYIPIDTKSLIEIFIKKEDITDEDVEKWKKKNKIIEKTKQFFLTNYTEYKSYIWKKYLNMKHNIFKNNKYAFDYRIQTDGLYVSLLFVNKEDVEKIKIRKEKMKEGKKNKKAGIEKKEPQEKKEKPIIKKENKFMYLDELDEQTLERIKNSNYICNDPGKKNLMSTIDNKENYYRYTNRQRVKETKRLKYEKIKNEYKKNTNISKIESELTKYTSRTCNEEIFFDYTNKKIETYNLLFDKYNTELFRKLKFNTYVNTQRSEDNLIKTLKIKYKDCTVIICGDWSIGKQMRNFISTPNMRLKKKLQQHFEVYLMDEYRTSCLSYITKEKCENLYLPDKKDKLRKIHSILTYKMFNKRIGCINRDKNGVNNISYLVRYWLEYRSRPQEFCRGKK